MQYTFYVILNAHTHISIVLILLNLLVVYIIQGMMYIVQCTLYIYKNHTE